MSEWYYEQGGQRQGPVSESDMQNLVSAGTVNRETLVWRDGMADWKPLQNTELSPEPAAAPDPATPSPAASPPATSPAPVPTPPPAQGMTRIPRQVCFNENFQFSIREVLGRAWSLMCADFWVFVGLFALAYLLYSVASSLYVTMLFIGFPVMGGFMFYTLRKLRGQHADIENLFDGFRYRFGSLAIITLFLMIPVLVLSIIIFGTAFVPAMIMTEDGPSPQIYLFLALAGVLAIVGVVVISILSIVTAMAALLCMDCDVDWKTGLSMGWRAYRKYPFKMFLFSFIAGFLYNIGVILLFVGVFVTGAWITAAYSFVYEKAFGDQPDSQPERV